MGASISRPHNTQFHLILKDNIMSGSGKEVLVLGAGMVVRPLVPYLTQHGYRVVVASRTLAKAQHIVEGISGAKAVECDVDTDEGKAVLETLLPSADAVVSLLPYLLRQPGDEGARRRGQGQEPCFHQRVRRRPWH